MADELKLDIIVDEHGGVQILENVDKGVKKVTDSAAGSKGALDELGKRFGVNTVSAGAFAQETRVAVGALETLGITAEGLASGGLVLLAAGIGGAVHEAMQLQRIGDGLEAPASRLNQLAQAAADFGVEGEHINTVLGTLQERLASGRLDGALKNIHVELASFKRENIAEQLLEITDHIAAMGTEADRTNARVAILGPNSQEMAGLMKTSFHESADAAHTMSDQTIKDLNAIGETFARVWRETKALSVSVPGGILGAMIQTFREVGQGGHFDLPTLPQASAGLSMPVGPEPRRPVQDENMMRLLEMEHEEEENWFRIDAIMRQVDATQKLIVKSGGDWSDVLTNHVAVAVDKINAGYVNAVMLNSQLGGEAAANRDRLIRESNNPTNPNESAFDRDFNAIDQNAKMRLAMLNQTDRVSAAKAENDILGDMNEEIRVLQANFEAVNRQPQPAAAPSSGFRGGAVPVQNVYHIDASGSVNTSGFDELVRLIEQGLAQRGQNQGVKARR